MSFPAVFGTVFLAMTCVVVGDTAGKLLTGGGVAPGFVAWSRFALGLAVLAPVLGVRRAEWRALADPRLWLRAALIAGGIASILTALRTEPIADAFGALFVGPLVAYALSALLLGERVTAARTALVLLGFAGVLLVVRPGFGMGPGMPFAVLAGVLYGGYLTATRWLAGGFRPGFLLLSQLAIGAALLAPVGVGAVPSGGAALWALVLVSALGSAAGNYLIVRVSRQAEASVVAPLIYTQLISAAAIGLAVFGTWPDAVTLAGLTLILVSGLASLHLARPAPAPARPVPRPGA
ncbi:MAG: DMT family transporter [Hasllibacter sp.]